MKAISLHQPYANLIASGKKTLETRKWRPYVPFPFDLLICSTKVPKIEPMGVAICVVTITSCRPMTVEDEAAACCRLYPGAKAWQIENLRLVKQFPVKGRQLLFQVDDQLIQFKGVSVAVIN